MWCDVTWCATNDRHLSRAVYKSGSLHILQKNAFTSVCIKKQDNILITFQNNDCTNRPPTEGILLNHSQLQSWKLHWSNAHNRHLVKPLTASITENALIKSPRQTPCQTIHIFNHEECAHQVSIEDTLPNHSQLQSWRMRSSSAHKRHLAKPLTASIMKNELIKSPQQTPCQTTHSFNHEKWAHQVLTEDT